MALADYDTAAEKIAALKCALMDPALVKKATSLLSVTEDIHLVTGTVKINTHYLDIFDHAGWLPPKISSGSTVDINSAAWAFLYVEDSDIVYSDPITLYSERLAAIIDSELKSSTSPGFTVGSNNALIVTSNSGTVYIDTKVICVGSSPNVPTMIPVKSGQVIKVNLYEYTFYIDLPVDW